MKKPLLLIASLVIFSNVLLAAPIDTSRITAADATHRGVLTAEDWVLFNAKQDALGFTPENSANKSTDGTMTDNSTILYPTQSAVRTYVSTHAPGAQSYAKEEITLVDGDIVNQYVDMSVECIANTLHVGLVSAGPIYEDIDYGVSVVAAKTRILFLGDLALGGSTSVITGDKFVTKCIY
jgi:hypothetical protein